MPTGAGVAIPAGARTNARSVRFQQGNVMITAPSWNEVYQVCSQIAYGEGRPATSTAGTSTAGTNANPNRPATRTRGPLSAAHRAKIAASRRRTAAKAKTMTAGA